MEVAERAATGLFVRQVRRGTVAIGAVLALMVVTVISTYDATSIGTMSGFGSMAENPAFRALYGQPYDLTTAGGFAVWRLGSFLLAAVGVWAVLAATRVLRGEEETGRWDLVLAAPLPRRGLTARAVAVLSGGAAVIGLAVGVGFAATGQPAGDSSVFAIGVALFGVGFVAVGALTSQVFTERRRAASIAGTVLGATYLLRMIADASADAQWLRWFTPFGWVEMLQPFAAVDLRPLVPLVMLPALLVPIVLSGSEARDVGDGLVTSPGSADARTRLLGSPLAFAWRQRLGSLAAWAGGLAVGGLVIGAVTNAFVDFIGGSAEMQDTFAQLGFTGLDQVGAFVALMFGAFAVVFTLQAVFALRTVWEDERTGRLEVALTAPVTRPRWLTSQVVAAVAAITVSIAVCGAATWVGVAIGSGSLSIGDALLGALNTFPLVLLFLGITVATHGLRPESGAWVPGAAVVGSYLLGFLGPLLDLPDAVTDLSPFRHLAAVPSVPVDWTATAVMAGLGLLLTAVGIVAYGRRDLR